eukprot:4768264-Prorocentrum_lima.AAC.1
MAANVAKASGAQWWWRCIKYTSLKGQRVCAWECGHGHNSANVGVYFANKHPSTSNSIGRY